MIHTHTHTHTGGRAIRYALEFCSHGVCSAPSQLTRVTTTVANVTIEQQPGLVADLLQQPFQYAPMNATHTAGLVRSGAGMRVTTVDGSPALGKRATVEARRVGGSAANETYLIREFPHTGNAVTDRAGMIHFSETATSLDTLISGCLPAAMCHSYLRVVVASGASSLLQVRAPAIHKICAAILLAPTLTAYPEPNPPHMQLRFVVEGVASAWSKPFVVPNSSPMESPTCSFIDIDHLSTVVASADSPPLAQAVVNMAPPEATTLHSIPFRLLNAHGRAVKVSSTVCAPARTTAVMFSQVVVPPSGLRRCLQLGQCGCVLSNAARESCVTQ